MQDSEAIDILVRSRASVSPDLSRPAYRAVKRTFDVAASGAAIVVLFIPSAVLCAVICAKSPGASPIYAQWRLKRVGKDGRFEFFRMYKFRSMVPNADKMLPDLLEANEADGPLFKMKEDPRVIPGIGRFIRKHSLAPVIFAPPGAKEPTNSFSQRAKTHDDLQVCKRHPGYPSVAAYDYTSPEKLSFGIFGGSGRRGAALARRTGVAA